MIRRHVLAVCSSELEEDVLDRAVEIARRDRARLTVVIPLREPSMLTYISPFFIGGLAQDLEREVEEHQAKILLRVPGDVPVTIRPVRRDAMRKQIELDHLPPVDLVVYREPSVARAADRRLSSPLVRRAAELGVAREMREVARTW